MWEGNSSNLLGRDASVVSNDFIVAEGTGVVVSSILDADKNPFGRDFFSPIFYIWKVHDGQPMEISSCSDWHLHVYPISKKRSTFPSMPARVFEDRSLYDCCQFVLAPFDVNIDDTAWEKRILKDGFARLNGDSLDASLLYADHGAFLHSQDMLKASVVMPSQLRIHFWDWLIKDRNIYSHNQTFEQKLEGRFNISPDSVKGIYSEVIDTLEKRYDIKLFFRR